MKSKRLMTAALACVISTTMLAGCNIPVNIPELGEEEQGSADLFGDVSDNGNGQTTKEDGKDENTGSGEKVEVKKSELIPYTLDTTYQYEWNDTAGKYVVEMFRDLISVDKEDAPALAATLDRQNEEWTKELEQTKEEYLDDINGYIGNLAQDDIDFCLPYLNQTLAYVKRADQKVFSIEYAETLYLGGAHNGYEWYGITYDTQTGKELSALDFVDKPDELAGAIADFIYKYHPDTEFWYDDLEQYIKDAYFTDSDEKREFCYYVDYDSITFFFNPYELASFADGLFEVKLTYNDYKDLLKDEYFEDVPDNYVIAIDNVLGYAQDFDNNGQLDGMCFGYTDNEYYEFEDFTVYYNNNPTVFEDFYFFDVTPYYVKVNGKSYLYAEFSCEDDYHCYRVYDLNEGGVTPITESTLSGSLNNFVDPQYFELSMRTDTLGTWGATAYYKIDDDGLPTRISRDYKCGSSEYFVYTLKQDLTCDEINVDTYEVKKSIILKAGTDVQLYASDLEDYAVFRAEDGRFVKVNLTYGDPNDDDYCFGAYVNGIYEQDLFENLFYAG